MTRSPVDGVQGAYHDKGLAQALAANRESIENPARELDEISEDIKRLEAYLNKYGVRVTVTVYVPNGTTERVAWGLAEPDRWRLVWIAGPEQKKALIETTAGVRRRARSALPLLVDAIARELDK